LACRRSRMRPFLRGHPMRALAFTVLLTLAGCVSSGAPTGSELDEPDAGTHSARADGGSSPAHADGGICGGVVVSTDAGTPDPGGAGTDAGTVSTTCTSADLAGRWVGTFDGEVW